MRYCRLTDYPNERDILIDLDDVSIIIPDGRDTCHLVFKSGIEFYVKHSFEEIVKLVDKDDRRRLYE